MTSINPPRHLRRGHGRDHPRKRQVIGKLVAIAMDVPHDHGDAANDPIELERAFLWRHFAAIVYPGWKP